MPSGTGTSTTLIPDVTVVIDQLAKRQAYGS